MLRSLVVFAACATTLAQGQTVGSFPHNYPGQPSGDLSPEWQDYFQVKDPLPNVSFPLGRNWAGNIPVGRPNQPNDTLFFWGFEKENGSFTANSTEPWGIWLNGGPGSSSMVGLFFENGPLHIANDYSMYSNNHSWDKLADWIWVDQPVGVGFGTVQEGGFVPDEDQMGIDFLGFLENLVKVFPGLSTRPLYIAGESYAGTYIPYIAKAYFGLEDPPVNLAKIAIGDGTIGNDVEFRNMPAFTVLETFPQLIGYNPEVYEYFRNQHHLCGFDLNLTYPQQGKFPTLSLAVEPGFLNSDAQSKSLSFENARRQLKADVVKRSLDAGLFPRLEDVHKRDKYNAKRFERREQWKRDLSGRPNDTIDPWYGCFLLAEVVDYALNFSLPWAAGDGLDRFDSYDVTNALYPEAPMNASVFLNDDRTRAAIHAPTSKNWASGIRYLFGGPQGSDPSVEPMAFFDDLAANATERGVGIVIFSGNYDSLISHVGSQVVIQNTTFGSIQGFTQPPSTPWFDDDGNFAGIVHQERNWTYVLVQGASHLVPQQQPRKAFVFLREFVLGSNQTGLVMNSSGTLTVIGGENSTLTDTVLRGQDGIYVGSGVTQSTFLYPSATIEAWNSFFATARGSITSEVSGTATASSTPSA